MTHFFEIFQPALDIVFSIFADPRIEFLPVLGIFGFLGKIFGGGGGGGGGGGNTTIVQQPVPPAPQPVDYAKMYAEATKAGKQQLLDQEDAIKRLYPSLTNLQLGTASQIQSGLDNQYFRTVRDVYGNELGASANLSQIESDIQKRAMAEFNAGTTAYDKQIQKAGQDAMLVKPSTVIAPSNVRQLTPANITGQTGAAATTGTSQIENVADIRAAQAANIANVQAQNAASARMSNVENVQAQQISAQQSGTFNQLKNQTVAPASTGAIERVSGTRVAPINAMQGAQVANVNLISPREIQANNAELALMQQATGGLLGTLENQASSELGLGRSLTTRQQRDVTQSTRAAYAARGLATSNSAIAAEILNRDRFATQRENERRAFASGVINQGIAARQAANAANLARQEGNVSRALAADTTNQNIALQRVMQNAELSQQAALTNNQNEQQRALAEAGYAQQAGLSNQDFGFRSSSQNAQFAQQAALANQETNLRAAQINQAADIQNQQFNAGQRQTSLLANQDAALRAALANQQAAFNTGQINTANQQQTALANQDAALRAAQFNQATGLQLGLTNAQLAQQAGLANFDFDTTRAIQNAQLAQQRNQFDAGNLQQMRLANMENLQQAAMVNQDAALRAELANQNRDLSLGQFSLAAQQANQEAQMRQLAANRGFMLDANNAYSASEDRLYGLGISANQLDLARRQRRLGLATGYADLDPYTRALNPAFGLGTATMGQGVNLVGQTFGDAVNASGNVASFNANLGMSNRIGALNYNAAIQGAGMQAAAARDAGMMNMMGGMMQGLGSFYSDRRMKKDIKPIGKAPLGLTTYEYRYKEGDGKKRIGFIAQDVQKVLPSAVVKRKHKGKTRLAIKPAVIGKAIAKELADAQRPLFAEGYIVK